MAEIFKYNPYECTLCPRRCHADRVHGTGFCGAGNEIRLARAAEHLWEEPCISGTRGSGALFFSGCALGCVFCQNNKISTGNFGAEITGERLAQICSELKSKGVHNISFITADHYIPYIVPVLRQIKCEPELPVVFNCSGYESPEQLAMLDGLVDIYLPDFKYCSPELSMRYSGAPDYFKVASAALAEMVRQTGAYVIENGLLKKGVLVRHLVLPGCRADSMEVIRYLASEYNPKELLVGLMSQYTPNKDNRAPSRRLTAFEYDSVRRVLEDSGFQGYYQEKSSAKEEYTPVFDLEGVINAAPQ